MSKVIGTAVNRKDGYAKVTGTATYSAEHDVPGLVHGVVVTSTIANGRIKAIDTREAEKAPGVIAVFTPKNAPKVFKPSNNFMTSKIYEARLPLSDDQIHYAGQIIGLVVADTFERARHGAQLVKVEYDAQKPTIEAKKAVFKEAPPQMGEEFKFVKGDVAAGMAGAATKVEATYTTSTELHAPMEPHAIIAHWQGTDALTVYEPSQFIALSQRTYAELFGLPSEKVRIIIPYLGGAFGSKAFPWPHGILAAAAARQIKRPLKVVLSRRQVTANAGHRSETEQTVRLAAAADGMLSAIAHEVKSCTSPVETFTEPCTSVTPAMYTAPNLLLNQELAVMNIGTPTFMRAPGEAPGMWALESAMDELAWALKLDPIELRLKNEAKEHQRKGLPFSAKHFADCLKVGAERFGWKDRPEPRSLTRDGKLIGWGMAAATFPGLRGATSAKVRLLPDGSAHVLTSGNDMGTGSYTVVAITAAETLGIPVEKVRVEMGDSQLPDGGLAGGSQMTASLVPTVMKACQEILKNANCTTGTEACAALQKTGRAAIEASASSAPGDETKKWAFQSWGAHFCEVTVDEAIGRLRVTRWVSVMDVGRIINTKAAASQVRGGVIMGIGQALMEECHFDPNTGYPVVYDLATYHFPAHADTPRIDVAFVGEPDLNFNPAGARGVGEIGITGVSAAIANAVYHATGKRLRSLPLTPDKLLV
ncbi:Periplasmic aromatic aldehyde oxidoreductase, molybdenum binding subunit YagR [uncultured Leptolyngbya sp.]|uniref:Periplasmic aromatic aldehyde oxidoreductase, molybdenum binding subunit YagR n=1 Tax=uncultured Leptolyngbya sp. TaxID=332963 RepID=A0A6J4PUZ8_9CYAN|nr:Periplasmic aromatic aldehyde oxidoreductase, molybdenum binding subunit YagR [uncultured Leptolyngbya sp.]